MNMLPRHRSALHPPRKLLPFHHFPSLGANLDQSRYFRLLHRRDFRQGLTRRRLLVEFGIRNSHLFQNSLNAEILIFGILRDDKNCCCGGKHLDRNEDHIANKNLGKPHFKI